jgi:hypothetical protein
LLGVDWCPTWTPMEHQTPSRTTLSMTGHWTGQAFEGEIPFSGRSSSGGFWSRKVENALSFNGD